MADKPDWYGTVEVSIHEWWAYVNPKLGFETYPLEQDWGLTNSDGSRVEEFLDFYYGHPLFPNVHKTMLGELILGSFDRALIDSCASTELEARMRKFCLDHRHRSEQRENFEFFESDAGTPEDPTPIGPWLRALFESQP